MSSIPILDLSLSSHPENSPERKRLLDELHDALFHVGFLYVKNHGVAQTRIEDLTALLPRLFSLSQDSKNELAKTKSPHFVGYNGFAQEKTLGKPDLREQFDFATELPVIWRSKIDDGNDEEPEQVGGADHKSNSGEEKVLGDTGTRDLTKLYWRLRGPNLWPREAEVPGFRKALTGYHDALSELSYHFVHLVEEAFGIPIGTFDELFFPRRRTHSDLSRGNAEQISADDGEVMRNWMPPQHRIKLLKYPAVDNEDNDQGVGPHKDSSGWLTFLYQVPNEEGGLEVLSSDGSWIKVPPIEGTLVVNFGNAFEAATEGAVRATVHRVKAPTKKDRYSIPFFMGLPLDLTVSEMRSYIPAAVRALRRDRDGQKAVDESAVASFLDPRWDSLGESQLRKWIRSHEDVGRIWYGDEVCEYYLQ